MKYNWWIVDKLSNNVSLMKQLENFIFPRISYLIIYAKLINVYLISRNLYFLYENYDHKWVKICIKNKISYNSEINERLI